ncbi:diadenylate cyclase CdaA [Gemmatimonas sp.]|uniref:diadenylate cyclase CdaA n=1 Tax=Gemmatimonas sp. TaxID=1962908 RepID=UPI00286BE719|nr:diadenylate cyclase CdaA [Gemmatimonas sp.]
MTGLANEQVVQITTQFTWRDGLEIGVVALVFYRILLLIHGTRALQILGGVAVLVAAYAIASLLQLTMITYLLGLVFTYGVFALLIIFQPELRAALAHLGQAPVTRLFKRVEQGPVEDDIADAVDRLSRSGVGAIIAIERDVPLSDFIDSGSSLQAKVSADLLTTIFTPYSPLHDGAVIIRGDTIVGAGCILPLSQGAVGHRSLGTRHRAALGLAEETDAIVIVVSEETAVVSVARDGALQVRLTPVQLRDLLAGRAVKSIG